MVLVGLALLLVVGCSGSKVTTKASAELSRYQVRTIALVPFTTLATPQARDVADRTFSVPPNILRSDMGRAVPLNIEQPLSQTVSVPTGAGDIVTQLLWSRLQARQGVTVLSPNEAAKALMTQAAQGGCVVDRTSAGVSGTGRGPLWRQPSGDSRV
jgi:hypothetical protein